MRVVAGRHRGRRLRVPPGEDIRPTADRVREAIFNKLAHAGWGPGGASAVPGAAVLDAFCGAGALGLEALSRGAACAVFMDTDRTALDAARDNAVALGEQDRAEFLACDATAPPPAKAPCTLVLMDPPYRSGDAPRALTALTALAGRGWIEPGAICVVETAAKDAAPDLPPGFVRLDERSYGAARVTFLRHEPDDPGPRDKNPLLGEREGPA